MRFKMLEISRSIAEIREDDIGDNLLYYQYNIKHLNSLIKQKVPEEDLRYISSYRSFEGEVFENYIYEKLLVYARQEPTIKKFILKGHHQHRKYNHANTLSISEKSQIVYRTKTREISEFDAMMFTDEELYFVEITLVKSVAKLKKRLRKKRALLQTIFPNYKIKALIILNEGVGGTKQLPDYCTVWITKPFSAQKVLDYLCRKQAYTKKPKQSFKSGKFIEACDLKIYPFKYYNVLSWITSSLRFNSPDLLDQKFLNDPLVQRYHDLYTKIYIGYMSHEEFEKLYDYKVKDGQDVVVALEKKHNDEIELTYYIQYSRKKLDYISFDADNTMHIEKKDPYGITVTEVYHVSKMMSEKYLLSMSDILSIQDNLLNISNKNI